ncbi:MAG: glyceraldehyde 3-phosphate dehydrogenase [Myxococcota bacterium]|jgi:glyceraldehyde 3-phosphate dehydrogenase
MSVPKIAINGFGRIGRTICRLAKQRKHFDIVAINDLASPEALQYAFQYDSVHGTYPGDVELSGNTMTVDGDPFLILNEPQPSRLPWAELGVDYVIESSGIFRKLDDLKDHLDAGAKRVILTVPSKDFLESTLVMGVNDHVVKPESQIISNASCTTNCAAPVAKVLHDSFGIRRGFLNTIHAYTSDQHLVDSPHPKDMRRSRSAATNIIPTSTGAAKAIGRVIPELEGRLDGLAMRVPVPDGSVVDLTVELNTSTTVEQLNDAIQTAALGPMAGILEYSSRPIVSSDIVGNTSSSIFDSPLTQVVDGRLVKVIAWYDNEWGYSARVDDLICRLAQLDGMSQ